MTTLPWKNGKLCYGWLPIYNANGVEMRITVHEAYTQHVPGNTMDYLAIYKGDRRLRCFRLDGDERPLEQAENFLLPYLEKGSFTLKEHQQVDKDFDF